MGTQVNTNMSSQDAYVRHQAVVPDKIPTGEYPLIDNDPHFKRVMRYTRPSDWAQGTALGALSPGLMLYWERVSPSMVGKGGFAPIMRLSGAVGVTRLSFRLLEVMHAFLRRPREP